MTTTNFVAKNLRYLRKQKGLSQQALASELGLTRSNIASYESGKAEPRAQKLAQVARYFDVTLLQLIEDDLSENPPRHLSDSEAQSDAALSGFLDHHSETVESFIRKSDEMKRILEGFREFYKFRMNSYKDLNADLRSLAADFENLLSVMEGLLNSNEELIDYISRNR